MVSDIMLAGELPKAVTESLMAWVGCVAGALHRDRYLQLLSRAGLTDVEVLKDVDYLAVASGALPADLQGILDQASIDPATLEGIVRSVTYRARRPR